MRPPVHVNCASTLDGYVGGPGRTPLKISNDQDMKRVHELRAASDAILVGVGTVVADDPKLTVKWELLGRAGQQPLRVVLDPDLRTPETALVLDQRAATVLFARHGTPDRPGVDVERVPADAHGLDLGAVLETLGRRGVRNLLVEGGPRTIAGFLGAGLVDAFTLFVASRTLGAIDAPRLSDGPMDLSSRLKLVGARPLGDGVLVEWRRPR